MEAVPTGLLPPGLVFGETLPGNTLVRRRDSFWRRSGIRQNSCRRRLCPANWSIQNWILSTPEYALKRPPGSLCVRSDLPEDL